MYLTIHILEIVSYNTSIMLFIASLINFEAVKFKGKIFLASTLNHRILLFIP